MNQVPENYILVKNQIYYTLRFYFPHLSLLAQPVNILYLLTGYEGNSKITDPEIPTIARGEIVGIEGSIHLLFPEYLVIKCLIIPK
jgi:hypothetical protein